MAIFYDTECYKNYWLLRMSDGRFWCIEDGAKMSADEIESIDLAMRSDTMISFNGLHYDQPMIRAALLGYSTYDLKRLSDRIIVDGVKSWELGPEFDWSILDHIDIKEVLPGSFSQKMYAGIIHYESMQDLPYDPDIELTPEQKKHVFDYCGNDLGALEALYMECQTPIDLRSDISKDYSVDVRSKSDAQVAETVIRKECERIKGERIYKMELTGNETFSYIAPDFVNFSNSSLLDVVDQLEATIFKLDADSLKLELPDWLNGKHIPVGGNTYTMGIGGLHSGESRVHYVSNDKMVITNHDVASYYPSLIINSRKWPEALAETFQEIYKRLYTNRLKAKARLKTIDKSHPDYKRTKVEEAAGKIFLNGIFGKLGSPYSVLFAPAMLLQTTITGQLSLLMLIERLELSGIKVISANTDGIVTYSNVMDSRRMTEIIRSWEKDTNLVMESEEFSALYSRDVNNYVAVHDDSYKAKGDYAQASLMYKKQPNADICAVAVCEYLAKGAPIEETILSCRDIRQFLIVRKVNNGAIKLHGPYPDPNAKVHKMEPTLLAYGWVKSGRRWVKSGFEPMLAADAYKRCFPIPRPEPVGKAIRWYYASNAAGRLVNAKSGNMVGDSDSAKPLMRLTSEFPTDILYVRYIDIAISMLNALGVSYG